MVLGSPPDPGEVLSEENRAILSFFSSEVAKYLEVGMGNRLSEVEGRLDDIDSRLESPEERRALKGIIGLFSKYKLFNLIQAVRDHGSRGTEFTKNTLIREAGVGQSFRESGLNRLIDILSLNGLIREVGKRGRGVKYRVTGRGLRFLQKYLP